MKLMRKYRVFVCAVLILCFFSFHISRPRQALAIVPAVSLAAAAVLAVGAAAGLSYTFDNDDAESIAGRLQAFLDDVHPGTAIADYFSARGAAVKDGLLYIGRSLYNRIKEFLQWEVSENNISAGNTVVVSSSSEFGYYTADDLYLQSSLVNGEIWNGTSYKNTNLSNYGVSNIGITWPVVDGQLESPIVIAYSSNFMIRVSTVGTTLSFEETEDSGVTWTQYSYPANTVTGSGHIYNLTVILSQRSENLILPVFMSYYVNETNSHGQRIRAIYANLPWSATALSNENVSTSIVFPSSLSLTASDVISYPDVADGQSVCVDVGMLTGSTIDEVADEIIDAAIDGTLSPSISAETWTVDVVATPQELAQDLDTDLTTEVEDNPTVPDSETIEFDTPSHYSVRDLRQFFPFCIPFDLFDMLGVLAAQPVAPHFEYRFQPGIANIDYTIVIDFQQFDSVALLLRRLETLSFCIGLAMVTRNLIRG